MLRLTIFLPLLASMALAQQHSKPPQAPPVRVTILNVCTPTDAEQKELASTLARIPQRFSFAPDYEVSRGHTTADEGTSSDWVRVRREYLKQVPLRSVQFSYIVDASANHETVVFYWREAKDVLQVALEDQVAAGTSPAVVLAADTPVNHLRVERYGKPSLVLARCPNADQTAYEPLFASASQIMSRYRARLQVRQIVPSELGQLVTAPGDGRRPVHVKPMGKR